MESDAIEARIAELLALAQQAYDVGRVGDTEAILAGLRSLTTTHLEVNKRLGVLLVSQGRFDEARPPLEDAAQADDQDDAVFLVLSACAFQAGEHEAALAYADRSLKLKRTSPDAHTNRGNALLRLGRPLEALEALRAAQMLSPRDAAIHANLANVLGELGRPLEALTSLDRAIALNPRLALLHLNRGNVLHRLGRHAEAVKAYDQAIELDPDCVDAHWGRGICQLLLGDYAAGWRGYEWRWRRDTPESQPRGFAPPLWLGEDDLVGRTILLHCEQGFGDGIQFLRYVPQVAERGATVVLEVWPALAALFEGFPGVARLVRRGETLPDFDLHCPLMSLPLALGLAEPDALSSPYLTVPVDRGRLWSERLGAKRAPRVGLVVSGSTIHANDQRRSLSWATLAPHLPAGLDYHLLQKEIREPDREPLAARPDVRVWASELGDFADTAALADAMDLVVSVDTSVAHLAGALGRPVALLLPALPDWRWGVKGEATPWYPHMTLYRQTRADDWSDPLTALSAVLGALS